MIRTLCKRLVSREFLINLLFGVLTTAVNYLVFWVFIHGLMVAKILLSFLVVVLNYIISKFLVFRNKNND